MCSIALVCWLAITDPGVDPPPINFIERSLPQVETGSLSLAQFLRPWTIRALALSPDDKLLAVAMANFNRGQKQGKVCVIDVASKATIAVPLKDSPDPICCVAFSADGKRLAACGYKTLKLWDVGAK